MIRAFLRIALLASLSSGTAAQYTPNFQGSIDLLSSVPSASAKEAAQAASDMLKKNSGASKALVDNKNPSPYLEDFDGSTRRHPAKHWRPGHETPPENVEVTDINGKKIRKRYTDLVSAGMTEADARRACDWIVALILAHEMRHVNQDDRILPTPKDRERDAYEYSIDIEASAFDAGSPSWNDSEAVQAAVFNFTTETLELFASFL